jgi:hypothetical protein
MSVTAEWLEYMIRTQDVQDILTVFTYLFVVPFIPSRQM